MIVCIEGDAKRPRVHLAPAASCKQRSRERALERALGFVMRAVGSALRNSPDGHEAGGRGVIPAEPQKPCHPGVVYHLMKRNRAGTPQRVRYGVTRTQASRRGQVKLRDASSEPQRNRSTLWRVGSPTCRPATSAPPLPLRSITRAASAIEPGPPIGRSARMRTTLRQRSNCRVAAPRATRPRRRG